MRNLAAVSLHESTILHEWTVNNQSTVNNLGDHRYNLFCNAINDLMIGRNFSPCASR